MQAISNIQRARAEAANEAWASFGQEGLANDIEAGIADDHWLVRRHLERIEKGERDPEGRYMASAVVASLLAGWLVVVAALIFGVWP